MTTKAEVLEALKGLLDVEHIESDGYRVRELEGLGWEGPRVVAFGKACETLKRLMKELKG